MWLGGSGQAQVAMGWGDTPELVQHFLCLGAGVLTRRRHMCRMQAHARTRFICAGLRLRRHRLCLCFN